jgi:hypothetical protein
MLKYIIGYFNFIKFSTCVLFISKNNLYFQVELKKEMIEQLTKYNLIDYVVWIDAVHDTKKPAYGCSLSHHKAYKDMEDNNYEACMILEDYCILKEFPFNIEEPVPDNWGLLYGGYLCYDEKSYKHKSFLRLIDARSTHCYIINKTILNYVKKMKLVENIPIDMRLINPIQCAVPCYGFYPINKAHQKPHKSTTCPYETDITNWKIIMNDKSNICYKTLMTDELIKMSESWKEHYERNKNRNIMC